MNNTPSDLLRQFGSHLASASHAQVMDTYEQSLVARAHAAGNPQAGSAATAAMLAAGHAAPGAFARKAAALGATAALWTSINTARHPVVDAPASAILDRRATRTARVAPQQAPEPAVGFGGPALGVAL